MKDLTEYLKKAFEFKNNGDYKKSIDYFYKALALDNESAEIMTELAILYSKLCQYDRAISFYEQIISLNPENFSVQLQYAMLLKTIKEYKHSEEILLNLYDKEYELEKVSVELFHLLFINNNFEKIVLYYNKCSNKLNNSIIFYYVAIYTKLTYLYALVKMLLLSFHIFPYQYLVLDLVLFEVEYLLYFHPQN